MWLRGQLRMKPLVLQALRTFGDLFRDVAAGAARRGPLLREEPRRSSPTASTTSTSSPRWALPRSRRRVLEKQTEIFNTVRRSAAELLGRMDEAAMMPPLPLSAFVGTQPIV